MGPESFPRRVRDQHGLYLVLVLVLVSVYVGATAVLDARVGRLWHLTDYAARGEVHVNTG